MADSLRAKRHHGTVRKRLLPPRRTSAGPFAIKSRMSATSSPHGGPALRAVPKVLLHEHLDGGLRPQTLFDLCRARGGQIPADDPESLGHWIHGNANSASTQRYLRGHASTC